MFILWCHQCLAQDPPTQEGSESAVWPAKCSPEMDCCFQKVLFLSPSDTCFEISQCSRPSGGSSAEQGQWVRSSRSSHIIGSRRWACLLPSDVPSPATPTFLSPSGCESFGQLCRWLSWFRTSQHSRKLWCCTEFNYRATSWFFQSFYYLFLEQVWPFVKLSLSQGVLLIASEHLLGI